MHERIDHGANLLKNHVFQFDFLNDDFTKLPQSLQAIINDAEKRKKLVIYINPTYAEANNRQTIHSNGENKSNVSTQTKMYEQFSGIVGTATRELFAQFFLRVYTDLSYCKLCTFSTLKFVNSQYFLNFIEYFRADFEGDFIVPANSFDNVKGVFPIGFTIWDLNRTNKINEIICDVYDKNTYFLGHKNFNSIEKDGFIINWLRLFYDKKSERIAFLRMQGTDIQNNLGVFITNNLSPNDLKKKLFTVVTFKNLIPISIYFSVRKSIDATWFKRPRSIFIS